MLRLRIELVQSACLVSLCVACGEAAPARPSRVAGSMAHESTAQASDWGFPRFFEVGRSVRLSRAAEPVDTVHWLGAISEQDERDAISTQSRSAGERTLLYREIDASGAAHRFALVLPAHREYIWNDRVRAQFSTPLEAFDFGVEQSRTFGAVFESGSNDVALRRLRALVVPAGTNAQDYRIEYAIDATRLHLLEHRGLIPGLPISFERFTLFDADERLAFPKPTASRSLSLQIGLRSVERGGWKRIAVFDTAKYRVLEFTSRSGEAYFLAAPAASRPSCRFGALSSDGLLETSAPELQQNADGAPAAAWFMAPASAGLLLSGRAHARQEIEQYLEAADSKLAAFERGARDFSARGSGSREFLRQYTHAFLESHRSKRDPRALTELAYGDHFSPPNARRSAADIRYGTDQASALHGLVSYVRRTGDQSVVGDLERIARASLEAATPSNSVWLKRFDGMLLTSETDPTTGRADAFIDNGAVSVGFNHTRLVLGRGGERAPGATWGAVTPVIAGQAEAVDSPAYRFTVDPKSIPDRVESNQEMLSASRLFERRDGTLRVRESARLSRGLPFARIDELFENTGRKPLELDEARLTIGDFFNYGDGNNEVTQNRYGFSRVFEGVPLHVGFWMEGMPEPLWGDGHESGILDVTEEYRRYKPRYLVIFGYDKAQLYYLARPADQVVLFVSGEREMPSSHGVAASNAVSGSDSYRGFTGLQVRYSVKRSLRPGEAYRAPPVYSYTLWAPLFSADDNLVPDEVERLAPRWAEIVEVAKDTETVAELQRRLESLTDRRAAERIRSLLFTALESDSGYVAMHSAWLESAELLRDLAEHTPEQREALSKSAEALAEAARKGAYFSLNALTQLRNRFDLMPAFGTLYYYGFHVQLFDWAYRETCDPRFRDAMLQIADRIATSEQKGGLQVTDPTRPNFGGYVINEFSRAAGSNNPDDQGMKLWALRVAFERTRDPKYEESAKRCIEHWIKLRESDARLYGASKHFDRYLPHGLDQEQTALGHYALMLGLRAWSDRQPRARELYARGLANAREHRPVLGFGLTGAYLQRRTDQDPFDFDTSTELGGMFLWALTFEPAQLTAQHRRFASTCHSISNSEASR